MLTKRSSFIGPLLNKLDPYFGIEPESEVAGRLRAAQINLISQTAPMMLFAKLICATTIFLSFYNHPSAWFLEYWVIALYLLAGLGFHHIANNKKREKVISASMRAYSNPAKAAFLSGLLWAIMPIILYPNVAEADRVIIIAVMSGMMGGGAMSLHAIPRALFIWVVTLSVGCILALSNTPGFASIVVLVMLSVYAVALIRSGYSMAKSVAQNILTRFELTNQSETIGLLLRDFSENASDWLWEMNTTGKITRGKDEFLAALNVNFTSISPGDYQGNLLGANNQVLNMRSLESLRNAYNNEQSFRDIIISSTGAGDAKWVSLSGKPLYNDNGQFIGFRGVASNVTDKKLTEERIAYLAHNDALTGLVNRSNYTRALKDLLGNPDNDNNWSILYLDLDGFKTVNDTYGHAIGDKLLGKVAKSLKDVVSDRDIVARLGGDEFAILCNSAGTVQSVSTLAESINQELTKPYIIDGITLDVGVSIGITLRRTDGSDAHTLMNNADLALYRAKAEGRGTYRLYEHHMDEIVKERRNLENDLKNALKNNELTLAYQPLICAKTTKTVSFEALARWYHSERGAVSPEDFIPIAEATGIIGEIGDWVLHQACLEAAKWPSELAVAVNLSPQQFQSNHIIHVVQDALKVSGLSPKRLELEITEGLFMENTDDVMFALRELKTMGVSISLDDFGTGYSSLSYLLKFPFDKLKIDRSLIHSLESDPNAKNVLEAITKLASVMNLTVTAEGIETIEQVKVLLKMHCTHFQGFLFGKPMTNKELAAYMLKEFSVNIEKDQEQITLATGT